MDGAIGVQNFTGFAVCFSRLSALTRPKLRLRFAKQSKSQKEQKSVSLAKRAEATYLEYRRQKRVRWERTGSDYLFANLSSSVPFVQQVGPPAFEQRQGCCENDRFSSTRCYLLSLGERCCEILLPFSRKWQPNIATTFHARRP
jgi:hypothetical protein